MSQTPHTPDRPASPADLRLARRPWWETALLAQAFISLWPWALGNTHPLLRGWVIVNAVLIVWLLIRRARRVGRVLAAIRAAGSESPTGQNRPELLLQQPRRRTRNTEDQS